AEMTRSRDRMVHLDERRAAAAGEQHELERTIAELGVERAQLAEDLAQVEVDEAREAQVAIEEHEQLEALREGERTADQEASELRTRAAQAHAAVAKAEATLTGFEQRFEDATRRSEKLEDELGRLGFEAEDVEVRQAALARQTVELAE